MTEQTFDPFASLALPDMLDQAKLKLVWHPHWERLKGTPLENDLPVLMVEVIHEYLKRHEAAKSPEQTNTREGTLRPASGVPEGTGEAMSGSTPPSRSTDQPVELSEKEGKAKAYAARVWTQISKGNITQQQFMNGYWDVFVPKELPVREIVGWQPIETAYRGVRVLVCGGVAQSACSGNDAWFENTEVYIAKQYHGDTDYTVNDYFVVRPTHWMPLPTTQIEDQAGGK